MSKLNTNLNKLPKIEGLTLWEQDFVWTDLINIWFNSLFSNKIAASCFSCTDSICHPSNIRLFPVSPAVDKHWPREATMRLECFWRCLSSLYLASLIFFLSGLCELMIHVAAADNSSFSSLFSLVLFQALARWLTLMLSENFFFSLLLFLKFV